jgi:hypothetical protein
VILELKDADVFSNWSSEICICICTNNLLSHTHTLTYTLAKLKNFAGNEKFWIFTFRINCVLRNVKLLLLHDCRRSEERIFTTKRSCFSALSFDLKLSPCSSQQNSAALSECGLWGRTLHRALWFTCMLPLRMF